MVNQRDCGYMPLERWSKCIGDFPDLTGQPCWVGLDLSSKIDLTSVGIIFPFAGKYYVKSHSFIPETRIAECMRTDKVPFDLWEKEGWITVLRGDVVDYRKVMDWVIEQADFNDWYIEEWCLDPWGGVQITGVLDDLGYTVVDIVQGIKTLSEPTKDFRDQIYQEKVVHEGNPVLSWGIGNAVVDKVDRNENILLNKSKSADRIDPIAAVINAFVRAMVSDQLEQGYASHGLRSL